MILNMVLAGETSTSRLPKEYQEVEWIQSSGTQYIDTGFVPNNNTRVVMDITVLNGTVSTFFGARKGATDSSFTAFCLGTTSLRSDYGSSQKSLSISGVGSRVVVDANKNVFNYGSYSVTHSAATFNSTYSLYLLQNNYQGSADDNSCMAAILYASQVYDNGTLVRDYVPCYRKSDGAIGLYDIVNDGFYGNAGTGTFTKGADVSGGGSSGEAFEFTYSGNYTDNRVNGIGTVRLNTSGTLTVTGESKTVSAYILGGGGGAAYLGVANWSAGGGGGGNQTVSVELTEGTYDIVIGTGGAGLQVVSGSGTYVAKTGGNTTAFGATSTGGKGGDISGLPAGGNGGSPNGANGNSGEISSASGGSPNGGSVVSTTPNNGGDGYVELTFL